MHTTLFALMFTTKSFNVRINSLMLLIGEAGSTIAVTVVANKCCVESFGNGGKPITSPSQAAQGISVSFILCFI